VINMNIIVARCVMVRVYRFGTRGMLIWAGMVSLHLFASVRVSYYLANASVIRVLFTTVTALFRTVFLSSFLMYPSVCFLLCSLVLPSRNGDNTQHVQDPHRDFVQTSQSTTVSSLYTMFATKHISTNKYSNMCRLERPHLFILLRRM
jgi:hypothetical protein